MVLVCVMTNLEHQSVGMLFRHDLRMFVMMLCPYVCVGCRRRAIVTETVVNVEIAGRLDWRRSAKERVG